MNRKEALAIVKQQLPNQRYQHTIGVLETAVTLAKRYGADVQKAELAAIFHDYAKFRSKDEMKRIIIEQKMDPQLLLFNSELWHAPVGAYLVQKEVNILDADILDAIRYHTSGRPGMPILEKVIYLADYIEPGRHFPGVEVVREMAESDLDQALISSIRNTILFLVKKDQPIYPDTFYTFNNLIMNKEN
jgi:predicted HD superfamily hydrolase involved in NAD metabolism